MNTARLFPQVRGGKFALTAIVRLLIFGTLAIAVLGKIQNVPAILSGDSLLSNWTLLKFAIVVEIFAAAYILVATRSTAWVMAVALFSTFSVFAAYELISIGGCNCFGRSLPNWLSLPVDLLIVGVMVGSRKNWLVDAAKSSNDKIPLDAHSVRRIRRRDAIAIAIGAGSALLIVVLFLPSPETARQREVPPNLRFLLAQDWVGEAWPVGQEMNANLSSLYEGKWLVLVLRRDCTHCRELAQELIAAKADRLQHGIKIATIVVGADHWVVHLGQISMETSGRIQVEWPWGTEPFVASPAAFLLNAGTIQDARDGKACREFTLEALGITSNSRR